MPDLHLIAQTNCNGLGDTDRFNCELTRVIDIISFLSIPIAIGSVIIIGIILIASVNNSNGALAAHTIKKFILIAIGVNIVFNAHFIASLVVL